MSSTSVPVRVSVGQDPELTAVNESDSWPQALDALNNLNRHEGDPVSGDDV